MMKANKFKKSSALAVVLAICLIASNFLVGCSARDEKKHTQKEDKTEETAEASKEKITPEPVEETTATPEEVNPTSQGPNQEEATDTSNESATDTTDSPPETNGENTSQQNASEEANVITTKYFPPDGSYHNGSDGEYPLIEIERVDASSFNFRIYVVGGVNVEDKRLIFKEHTATFEEQDGTIAFYRGENYTLSFDCWQYGFIRVSGFSEGFPDGSEFANGDVVVVS